VSAPARVHALVRDRDLAPPADRRLLALLALLDHDEHAPSSVRDAERATEVHLADSLSALDLPVVRNARRVADLGSGAGFPGLALAIALPQAHVALVESSSRKCAFLERAVAVAQLGNVEVVCTRVEEWAEGSSCHDLVTARALGELALVCEYAAPLMTIGGSLVAWKGAVSIEELNAGELAAAEVGLEPAGVVRASPYPGSETHCFHTYVKTAETPTRFPRRPGAARKRPLGHAP